MLYILYKNVKTARCKDYLCAIFPAVFIISIYLIYNYLSVGNPVFPYYNNIFKSKYYYELAGTDPRWGPKGIKEILLWPFIIFFSPERWSELPCNGGRLLVAYGFSLIVVVIGILKKQKDNMIMLMNILF